MRNRRPTHSLPLLPILSTVCIVGLCMWLYMSFSSGWNTTTTGVDISVEKVSTDTEAYIVAKSGKKELVSEKVSTSRVGTSVTVAKGKVRIHGKIDNSDVYMVAGGEIVYTATGTTVANGRIWVKNGSSGSTLSLRNMDISLQPEDTVLVYQNSVASSVYALSSDVDMVFNTKTYTLPRGKWIVIQNGEKKSSTFVLQDNIEPIGESILTDDLFVAQGGKDILDIPSTIPGTVSTGTTTRTGSDSQSVSSGTVVIDDMLRIVTPRDESSVDTAKVTIKGDIIDLRIVKVTIDEAPALTSPVDANFVFKDYILTKNVNNIVYKWYDIEGNMLTKWTISIYAKNISAEAPKDTVKPTVTNFPVSDKQFRIQTPTENPYKTTETNVSIRGTVPADIVQYISVNGYRLQKFKPLSTAWTYYANVATNTLKDGINEYTVVYVDANGTTLSTGKVIIVKESVGTESVSTDGQVQ